MANWKAGTSSDAAGTLGCEHDVFLNFRGEDTRYNFTAFLYDYLENAGVHTFMDEEKLPFGDVISDRLECAINNSKLYIPIFSRNYAFSKCCLWELKLIMDNVSNSGGQKSIFPIFLLVKPDDLKLKTRPDSDEPYKAAFEGHEKNFRSEVQAWKTALGKVDGHKGWVVEKNTSQVEIVKSVVEKVLEKLEINQKLYMENLVGLDDQAKELRNLLDVNNYDVRLIAIYGMGGIGKTTLAKVIFNELSSHFKKHCSFLEDIRESSSTKEGIVQLQRRLLSDIGDSSFAKSIMDSEKGRKRIEETLPTKKVLVVLDDVAEEQHIKNLIGNCSLCLGSRIITTARDITIPPKEGFNGEILRYEVPKMNDVLALQLFCRHAIGRDIPSDNYRELSSKIVSSTGGLPLAIKVIGSLLKNRDREVWEETLANLKNIPPKEILKKLKISYDSLDENQKQIFLDIACFFFNKKKTDAIYMWASCRFQPKRGIIVLTERCLIKILDDDKLWMHDLLIDLGRQIVCEESQKDLEKQSRLWIAKEALQIIKSKERKPLVEALEISSDGPLIDIGSEDFKRLPKLRFLDLSNGTFVGDFAMCHSELRWFSWCYGKYYEKNLDSYFRADNFYLDQLVICELCRIDFKDDSKVWNLIKRAENLRVLYISTCLGITTIPDISRCSALERLTLYRCYDLKRIESFIGDLQSLIELKIKECSITGLPKEVGTLVKLKHFSLSNCSELRELPDSLENLTSLTKLNLSGTMMRELPNFIGQLKSLRILRFCIDPHSVHDIHDWQLPKGISTLVNLEELDLSGHTGMKGEILDGIGECSSLRILNLKSTNICGISRTINKLHHLQTLNLLYCKQIQELPELPTSLTNLLLQSASLLSIPNLSNLANLVELLLSNHSYVENESKPLKRCDLRWIGNLFRLKELKLDLLKVPAPLELASLSHLEELVLRHLDLKPLVQLPSSNWSWRNLSTLEIDFCEECIPLEGLPQLKELTVKSCVEFQRLSIPSELTKLQRVYVTKCPQLVEIKVVSLLKSLEELDVYNCESLTRISGLSYLKNLQTLRIESCRVLTKVEGLNELESLELLLVCDCTSLRRLIDASCTKIPDDCTLNILVCGYTIKDARAGMDLKHYREEIRLNASNKISLTIQFHLGVKFIEGVGFVGGIKREHEVVEPFSVTYKQLVADVKSFGFRLRRMWGQINVEDHKCLLEIERDKSVRYMMHEVQQAARRGSLIHLFVEGGVDSEGEGEYDEEMREMLREERRMKTGMCSDEDGAKGDVSCPNENSISAAMGGESEIPGNSSVDDFELDRGKAKCFEATTSIAEKDVDSVRKQVELHEKPRMTLTSYLDALKKVTIRFHLGVKMPSGGWFGSVGGIEREKEGLDFNSLTYKGLIADVKNFGFRFKRMWHEIPLRWQMEIKSDGDVKKMLTFGMGELVIHLFVEGGVDSEWKGKYDEEMMKMLREERQMKTDVHSDEDGAKGDVSCPNEGSTSAPVEGESETHGTSSIDRLRAFLRDSSLRRQKQVELHEEPKDEETTNFKRWVDEGFLNTLNKDGAESNISGFNEVPHSASVGEREPDGTSSMDDFQSEPGKTECSEATGNRRPMRDGRTGRHDSVDGGETASIKRSKKDRDEIGEPANPSDVVGSRGQTCKGVERFEKSCKATTEVEDPRDFSSVKREKTAETDRVPTKTSRESGTGCASKPGRDPTERGRGRGRASSSGNDEGSGLGRDAASTLGRGTASNSGRDIASSSRSRATSGLGRDRGSTSGKGTTLSSGRGMTLNLGTSRGSRSRMDTTKVGIASIPKKGITLSSPSSVTSSTGRGRDYSTSGKGTTVSSGRGMTLSLGMGRGSSSRTDTTKIGTTSSPRRGMTLSSRSGASLSTGRGRGSTSGKGTTVSSRRGMALSLEMGRGSSSRTDKIKMGTASSPGRGITSRSQSSTTLSIGRGRDSTSRKGTTANSGRGATNMGTSLRSGMNKGSNLAKAEPQTSRSLEEQ